MQNGNKRCYAAIIYNLRVFVQSWNIAVAGAAPYSSACCEFVQRTSTTWHPLYPESVPSSEYV
jgi:hypothetical protein